jgi:hypothetical protein
MLNEKIHVKILIVILACLTYKILFKKIEKFANQCPEKCGQKVGDEETGTCDTASGMCKCEDGWYDQDCQVKRQNWFSDQKSAIEATCTGEDDQKHCTFGCKDENGKSTPCLKVFYERKEGKMPDFWNNKKIPLLNLPKDSFFSVKRQSKWLINDLGVATKYELKLDKDGIPMIGENGQYQTKKRLDAGGFPIRDNYIGNWTDKNVERDDDGNELSREDVEYKQIPRIFELEKKEFDDACEDGYIHSHWCKEKKKILIEDPDDPTKYLDTGNINISRLIDPKSYGNISGDVGNEKDPKILKTGMGGISIEENDIQYAKKYAFAKLCLSKGYLYYEDEITGQPKCEFNKDQCLKFSKNFSEAKPDDSTGLPEKYKYAEWRKGVGCIQVNEGNKVFCEGDHICSTGKNRFKYNSETGECKLTEEYCNQFALTYDPNRGNGKNGQCITKEGQRFAETLAGSTISRSANDCPDYTKFYNTYRTNNLMEQWPNDIMSKINNTCQPQPTQMKDEKGNNKFYVCDKDKDHPQSMQCQTSVEGTPILDHDNLKINPVRRAYDSVKPWYMDDSVWPWGRTLETDPKNNNSTEQRLYAQGKLNCKSDSECETTDFTGEIAKAVGGREGKKICLMYRCMEKRTHTQSCDRDNHCTEGLVCHGLDGCGYPHKTRKNGETCNHWPECKSNECVDNGKKQGVKVCIPSDYDRTEISAELIKKNNIGEAAYKQKEGT